MDVNDVRRLELFTPELQRTLMLTVERGGLTCRMFVRGHEVVRASAKLTAVWMFESGHEGDPMGVELGVNGASFSLTREESEKVSALLGVAVVSYEELMRLCLEQV